MASDTDRDPERQRIDALVERVREGSATDAECEELELYAQDREETVALSLTRADNKRRFGGAWLARAEADKRIEAETKTPLALAERAVGSTLAVTGAIGSLFAPVLGIAAVAGLGVLGFSALRIHLKTAFKDPYKEIEK